MTARLGDSESITEATAAYTKEEDAMGDQDLRTVPALVSYFESQLSQSEDDSPRQGRVQGNGQGRRFRESSVTSTHSDDQEEDGAAKRADSSVSSQRRAQRESSVTSVCSDDGNTSANEGTQTEGSSVIMGKAPVSVLSAGDPSFTVSREALHAVNGAQNIQEESSIKAQTRRSWKLSIAPTDTWHAPIAIETDEHTAESTSLNEAADEKNQDAVKMRRKSKTDTSSQNPEKRRRQDKLTDLHSKYGLMDEVDRLSDEDSPQGTVSAVAGQGPPSQQGETKKTNTPRRDSKGNLLFEVTINQDETNVLYNVETTEYKTYTLRDSEDSAEEAPLRAIPDTININLTETTTHQREDLFETVTKERIIFDSNGKQAGENEVVLVERKYDRGHQVGYEQDKEGGDISRESSVERSLVDMESNLSLKIKGSQDVLVSESATVSPVSDKSAKTQASTITEHGTESPAESTISEDGVSRDATSTPVHTVLPTASLPKKFVMQREDISSTFRMNDSGSVASQLHQTIAVHQPLSQQNIEENAVFAQTVPASELPHKAQSSVHGQTNMPPRVTTYLQVELNLPNTPPPVKGKLQVIQPVVGQESSYQHVPGRSLNLPVTVIVPHEGTGQQEAQTDCTGGSPSRAEQVQEIPVVHLQEASVSSQGLPDNRSFDSTDASLSQEGVKQESSHAKYPSDRAKDSSCTQKVDEKMGRLNAEQMRSEAEISEAVSIGSEWAVSGPGVFVGNDSKAPSFATDNNSANQSHSGLLTESMNENKDRQDGGGNGTRFVPADSWLNTEGVTEDRKRPRSKNAAAATARQSSHVDVAQQFPEQSPPVPLTTRQQTQALDPQQRTPKTLVDSASSVTTPRVSHSVSPSTATADSKSNKADVKHDGSQRLPSHPSVGEVPQETVERLPHVHVEHGSQPYLMYPYCQDGILLYSSSSCSEDPYSWVDTFREETGIADPDRDTATHRRSRPASETAAKALLEEVIKQSKDSQSEEDDGVFSEEIVVISGQMRSVVNVPQTDREQLKPLSASQIQEGNHQGVSSGCQEVQVHESAHTSTEGSFYSPDVTVKSSSESSVYCTPQHSPQGLSAQGATRGKSEAYGEEETVQSESLPSTSLTPGRKDHRTPEEEEGARVLTAVVAAVGRTLTGATGTGEVEAMRQVLKQEVGFTYNITIILFHLWMCLSEGMPVLICCFFFASLPSVSFFCFVFSVLFYFHNSGPSSLPPPPLFFVHYYGKEDKCPGT